VVNRLCLLRGDLQRLDLARLAIQQAYLQGVEAQDASLAGSYLTEPVLAEAFAYPTALALSADGAFLAADHTLLLAAQGHTAVVWDVALSNGACTCSWSASHWASSCCRLARVAWRWARCWSH
jgi:hypothetical protein